MSSEPSTSRDPFTEYYERESLSPITVERFRSTQNAILRVRRAFGLPCEGLDVADIGCGAGTQSMIWAHAGHRVRGVDINEKLVEIGKRRAAEAKVELALEAASAVKLPWPSACVDVCLLPEVLEHVADWQSCLSEAVRILKPDGLLYLSTTNRLCPMQQEFELPFYSWYPGWLKRRYERLSVTTRPELVNHAQYPAVNWFDYFSLRRAPGLARMQCLDRFDVAALASHGALGGLVLRMVTAIRPLRWVAHVATPYTAIFAINRSAA
jgi:2-polyprenyl-6-hydroxyphenyl methylase/3-demethylubiquinone-9 3-methyltransferase